MRQKNILKNLVENVFVNMDVNDEKSVNKVFDTVRDIYGEVSILINNAGIAHSQPLEKLRWMIGIM